MLYRLKTCQIKLNSAAWWKCSQVKESSGHSGKGEAFPAYSEPVFHCRVRVYPYTYLPIKTREEKWVTGYIIFPPKLQPLRWTELSRGEFNAHQRRCNVNVNMHSQPIWLLSRSKPQLKLRVAQLYHEHVNINNCIFNALLNDIPVLSTFVPWSLPTGTLTKATKCTKASWSINT